MIRCPQMFDQVHSVYIISILYICHRTKRKKGFLLPFKRYVSVHGLIERFCLKPYKPAGLHFMKMKHIKLMEIEPIWTDRFLCRLWFGHMLALQLWMQINVVRLLGTAAKLLPVTVRYHKIGHLFMFLGALIRADKWHHAFTLQSVLSVPLSLSRDCYLITHPSVCKPCIRSDVIFTMLIVSMQSPFGVC